MGAMMTNDESETDQLLQRAAAGDAAGWEELLARNEPRLRRMIAFRLDQRLQGRIDASDVLQEVYLEAFTHLASYRREAAMPFFLWLRGITGNKLLELHRHHLGTAMRAAGREVSLQYRTLPETTSAALAAQLLGHYTRPSEAAVRAEIKTRLQDALNSLEPLDREVLALRHFEHLTTVEAAEVLGIKPKAAGKRYLRALERLKDILSNMPGGLGEFQL
jgi:RNA polymerase sigma-70 factor (ECF subfamily)